jgi:hypothetical protein
MKTMKAFLLGSVAWFGLAMVIGAQSPTVAPEQPSASPSATLTAFPSVSPAASIAPSAANEFADKIKEKVDRKFKHKGFDITIDGDEDEHANLHGGDIPENVIPIVAICMLAVFGFPVAIVAVIMFSSWAKSRSLHRTVRMMVEKGQPVPPELFASPAGAPIRPWYDLRRGIVLLSVGFGLMMFFGLTAGWDEGVWALGLIPGLIGLGYILAWRLANRHGNGFKQ